MHSGKRVNDKRKNRAGQLCQCLEDVDCSAEIIQAVSVLYEEGRLNEVLCLLSKHRCCLLNRIHADQKLLDNLDFLIYKLRTEKE